MWGCAGGIASPWQAESGGSASGRRTGVTESSNRREERGRLVARSDVESWSSEVRLGEVGPNSRTGKYPY